MNTFFSFLADFFRADSKVSSMRLVFFLSILNAVGLSWYGIMNSNNTNIVSLTQFLVTSFLVTATGGKIWQSKIESKNQKELLECQKNCPEAKKENSQCPSQ